MKLAKQLTWFITLGVWQLALAGLVVGFGLGWWSFSGHSDATQIITVTKTTLTQEVNVTGKIEAEENVDLGFETKGTVIALGADIGDQVAAGQALATLDGTELRAQVASARAGAAAESARLNELAGGTRPEELAIAQTTFTGATASLRNSITAAYTSGDNAIRNQADAYFIDPRTLSARVKFEITDFNTDFWLHTARVELEQTLTNWKQELMTGNTPTSDLIAIGITSQEHLQQVASFLDHLALAINNVSSSISTSNGITISEARTNIAAARTSITSAINSLATATDTYNNAKRELALKQAGATPQSIQAQEAKLAQAEAEVAVLQAQLDKTVLRAPFAGLVTRQDAKLGQGVSSGTSLVTLMANGALKITAKVPEVDIGKVSVGNKVMIRLDAFPGVDFAGTVSKIDPGETVLDGVVNYQITINFDEQDARLRSGLTANLDIITQNKEVLAVPESALVEKNNGVYVRKVVKGTILESAVTTGINGQDSLVEIVSGLEEGDQIMISAQ